MLTFGRQGLRCEGVLIFCQWEELGRSCGKSSLAGSDGLGNYQAPSVLGYGMVWCTMVRYGMVRFGMVRHGMVS